MAESVLDASALIAYFNDEPGAAVVESRPRAERCPPLARGSPSAQFRLHERQASKALPSSIFAGFASLRWLQSALPRTRRTGHSRYGARLVMNRTMNPIRGSSDRFGFDPWTILL